MKEVKVSYGETRNLGDFNSLSIDVSLSKTIGDQEDFDPVVKDLYNECKSWVILEIHKSQKLAKEIVGRLEAENIHFSGNEVSYKPVDPEQTIIEQGELSDTILNFNNIEVGFITEKAIKVIKNGSEHWVPKKAILQPEVDKIEVGDKLSLKITEWFAKYERKWEAKR